MRTWNSAPLRETGRNSESISSGKTGIPGATCVCPKCGAAHPHIPGTPCVDTKCPTCGTPMCRKY